MQRKRDKVAKDRNPTKDEQDWEANHPWRPFDRDKDLQTTKPRNQAELMKKMGDLSSRFGSKEAGSRKFL